MPQGARHLKSVHRRPRRLPGGAAGHVARRGGGAGGRGAAADEHDVTRGQPKRGEHSRGRRDVAGRRKRGVEHGVAWRGAGGLAGSRQQKRLLTASEGSCRLHRRASCSEAREACGATCSVQRGRRRRKGGRELRRTAAKHFHFGVCHLHSRAARLPPLPLPAERERRCGGRRERAGWPTSPRGRRVRRRRCHLKADTVRHSDAAAELQLRGGRRERLALRGCGTEPRLRSSTADRGSNRLCHRVD